jgi:hypothetical protein
MTDDVRPSWPGAQPSPAAEPLPEPPSAPAPPSEPPPAARPSWDGIGGRARRGIDLKLVIAVLIGLVSVTGAVMAFRSAIAGEHAVDKDRQAIAETVTLEQSRADSEVILQDARSRFADHAIAVVNAGLLEQQAASAADRGDEEAFRQLSNEASELRAVARRVLEGTLGPVLLADYVVEGTDGARPTFDEGALGDDLELIAASQNQINPVQTVREADRLRDESLQYDRWVIFIVGAVVLLTLAQISARKPLRLVLTGAGVSVWIVVSVLAFTGS